jgi:hypothetical protein
MATAQRQLSLKGLVFEPSGRLVVPAPKIIAIPSTMPNSTTTKVAHQISIDTPKLEVVEIPNALVVGGTNFTLAQSTAIHPDYFNPESDTCPAEHLGVVDIKRAEGTIDFYLRPPTARIEVAANLLGQSTNNYAHWLTETLPKLLIFDAVSGDANIPVLVDSALHSNMYESLRLLNRFRRTVHIVERWGALQCGHLFEISQTAYEPYIPHRLRNNEITDIVNSFSPRALSMLREFARAAVTPIVNEGPRRLYLARSKQSNNLRQLINNAQVEALIANYGFTKIESNNLTFAAQVLACMSAEIIIAPVGAALANMIFAQAGCRIVVFAPYFETGNYHFYSNLAAILGHHLVYLLGQPVAKRGVHPTHADYSVEIASLRRALNEIIGSND